MSTTIEIRRDTAANWTSVNPILATGEIGFETDTRQLKVGNGMTAWVSLGYGPTIPADALAAEAWTAITPVLWQGGAVATTVNMARYKKFGRLAVVQMSLTATGAGSAGQAASVNGIPSIIQPVTTGIVSGVVRYLDLGVTNYIGIAHFMTAAQVGFYNASADYFGITPNVAMASGDTLNALLVYETAT